jgi:hypothetical protein
MHMDFTFTFTKVMELYSVLIVKKQTDYRPIYKTLGGGSTT